MSVKEWLVVEGVRCVQCPGCDFTFSAAHENDGGGYSCPCCGFGHPEPTEEELARAEEEERAEQRRLSEMWDAGYERGYRAAEERNW